MQQLISNGAADGPTSGGKMGEVTPTWFGPSERPLLGWIHHQPAGQARGAIVLCPPIGIELNFSQYVFKALARRLHADGFVVVRFDYDGIGQSAGAINDPGRVEAWVESIACAEALARAQGVESVAGVGLRLGATLLANAAVSKCRFDALVLWDPCVSGKTFLREQAALQLTFPHPAVHETGTEIPGYYLSAETVSELAVLQMPSNVSSHSPDVLALLDPQRAQNARLSRQLKDDGVDWREYDEEVMVFDTGQRHYDLPEGIMRQVAGWLDEHCSKERVTIGARPRPQQRATVGHTQDGRPIVEKLLRVRPTELFGIECHSPGAADALPPDAPVVLLLSIAAEPSIGPGRQWVELSRQWAAAGFRTVRFDLSGIGESPPRPGRMERHIYAPWTLDDIEEVARAVSPDDPANVVLVGVCSGAYSALTIGPHLRPRGVVAVNPLLTFAAFEGWVPGPTRSAEQSQLGFGRRAQRALLRAFRRLVNEVIARSRGAVWRRNLANGLPRTLWSLVYRLRLAHSPARLIDPLVRNDVPTLLLCGEYEASLPQARTPLACRRLDAARLSHFTVVPQLDHSLRDEASRIAAQDAITDFLHEVSREHARNDVAAVGQHVTPAAA
ncbi:MAG: alpha/beta fold hydrolase [Solirubrobacteraceae bacterium]